MMPKDFDWNTHHSSSKEAYLYPQPDGLLRVKDYLFAEGKEGRCVLLRWILEAEFPVDTVRYEVEQLDAAEECCGVTSVVLTLRDFHEARPGDTFIPSEGVAVAAACTSVRVHLREVTSGTYRYRVNGTRVETDYRFPDYWRYEKKPGQRDGLNEDTPLRVRWQRRARVGFVWPAAVLAVLVMVGGVMASYIRPLLPKPEEMVSETETLPYETHETEADG